MTFEEANQILQNELAKGGIDNPSHNIYQHNLHEFLVTPYWVETEGDDNSVIPAWILFRLGADIGGYGVGIDDEYGDFVFLVDTTTPGEFRYLGSCDSFADAVNNI